VIVENGETLINCGLRIYSSQSKIKKAQTDQGQHINQFSLPICLYQWQIRYIQ